MVLRTVFLPAACYTVPPMSCPSTQFSSLSLSCPSEDLSDSFLVSEELENEISEILPKFASADNDWNAFGYLLNQEPGTSSEGEIQKKITVFVKPVKTIEPIGKGRRRRRNADMEVIMEAAKPKAEVKKEVINPADITLGGDTYDYGKDQKPDIDSSIASGVSRRRRTSANLSKSEDDNDKPTDPPSHPTRGTKERRTSQEPPRVSAHYPGTPAPTDVDLAVTHCTCQQPFDASKHYIQCDMCARWYHGECVDVAEKSMIKLESWTCEQCLEEQERVKDAPALYCVCKKPYDDTKFYVGCDSCQGWFHPECVGTTREQAEQAAEYNCPDCKSGYESEGSEASTSSRASVPLTRPDYAYVNELLELLNEHRMNTPFRNPVDLNEFPDYIQYIKKPMDLSMIGKKVRDIEYQYLGHFVNDVTVMFENAKTYNPKDSAIFKCAETMQEVFDKKLIEVREQMTARQQMMLFQSQEPMGLARKRVQSESQKTVDSLDIDSDQLLPFDPSVMSYFDFQ